MRETRSTDSRDFAVMRDLFGEEGRTALQRLSKQSTLFAFDFDGTLAPIVDRPEDAHAPASTLKLLAALAALVPTAIVTGRSVDDIRQRLDFTPSYLIGNHGAEGLPDRPGLVADAPGERGASDRHRAIVHGWRAQWPEAIAWVRESSLSDIVVEPKSHSLSIHYRHAVDHDEAKRAIEAALARLDPVPRVIGGKCVFNLMPRGAPDKGLALAALVQHARCEAAFFIGDDVTDEAAFVDAPDSWVTVHVGRESASAARFYLDDQRDIDRCLALLVDNASAGARGRTGRTT